NFFLEILEILLENGADINLVHEELQGYTPFLFSIEIGDLDVFKLFCKYNPNINQKNISFMGPLEIALVYNHFELFKKLTIKYSFKEYDTLEKVLMLLYYTYGINKDYNLSYDKIKNYLWDFILKTNLNIFEKERLYFILKRSC
ncbi:ankyrin repeat domain-containing protein, partial [Fusobacterium sp.]|uniref:ankyrin repeat domain-containing protein n=1 Tax=Fusobacterium sp. TaxID=68766 RepID=UPI0026066B9B